MDTLLDERTTNRISAIVGRMLEKRGVAAPLEPTQNLRDAGLTSLDTVNLMLAVEGAFDIFIPQEQMTPENFHSIAAIEQLVSTLTSGR